MYANDGINGEGEQQKEQCILVSLTDYIKLKEEELDEVKDSVVALSKAIGIIEHLLGLTVPNN